MVVDVVADGVVVEVEVVVAGVDDVVFVAAVGESNC